MARKKRKKLKSSVKITLIVTFIILIVCAMFALANIQHKNSVKKGYGTIENSTGTSSTDNNTNVPGKLLTYDVIDVGQGQCILIDIGNTEVLIDAGNTKEGSAVCKKIGEYVDGPIEYVICSNSNPDHCGGLTEVYKKYDVKETLYASEGKSKEYASFKKIAQKKSDYKKRTDATITLAKNCTLTIYNTDDAESNGNNVITYVQYKEFSFLATGDASASESRKILGKVNNANVFVFGKHGDENANNQFLEASDDTDSPLSINYGVISAGQNNKFGYPTEQFLKKVSNKGISTFGTWINGDVKFTCDGISFNSLQNDKYLLNDKNAGGK